MRRYALLSAALLLATATLALAAEVSGRWRGSLTAGDGTTYNMVYTLRAEGQALTGSIEFVGLGEVPIYDGRVKGDSVFFSADVPDMKLVHRGHRAGDALHVALRAGPAPEEATFTLSRVTTP